MAINTHINGPALIKIGLQGTGQVDSLQTLGITEAGPEIDVELLEKDVMADNAGPMLEADVQQMGKAANIRLSLPIYDLTVLTASILSHGSGSAEGNIVANGTMTYANARGFRMIISSPTEGQPWRFFYVRVKNWRLRPGTAYNIYEVSLRAIPYVGVAATSANTYLYDHTDG